jgi:hypothetical protein
MSEPKKNLYKILRKSSTKKKSKEYDKKNKADFIYKDNYDQFKEAREQYLNKYLQ